MMTTSLFHTLRGRLYILLIFTSLPVFSQHASDNNGKLIVTLSGIRSQIGKIEVALYDQEDQWTEDPGRTYCFSKDKCKEGVITFELDSIPYAEYAIAVLDDENESCEMEYTLGIPKEGWGMSMNPSFLKLKVPGFREVCFDLDCPVLRLSIDVNYIRPNKRVSR